MNDKLGKGSGMRKTTVKADVWTDETGLEVIGVKIGGKAPVTYKGLAGTFASFTDSCLRKQVLPGFHEKGLIVETIPKEKGLFLRLSGKRSEKKLKEVMDIALINAGAYPDKGGKAGYFIDVESEK
jgi:hypothetical protein